MAILFRNLHKQIHGLDEKIHREKSSLRTRWNRLKKKAKQPENLAVFLVSGVVLGYLLFRKSSKTKIAKTDKVVIENRPHPLMKAVEIVTAVAPLATHLISSHLALEKKPESSENTQ